LSVLVLLAALVAGLVLALAAVSPGRAGTNSLTTTFAFNNGNDGVAFDVQAGAEDVHIDQIDVHLWTAFALHDVEIWTRPGSHAGLTGSNAGWTLVGSYTDVPSAGDGVATVVGPLSSVVTVPAGQVQAFLILETANGNAQSYTNGDGTGTVEAADAFLTIYEGAGLDGGFGGAVTANRIPNVTMHYTPESLFVAPPQWVLQAKIAGGNTLNPFLPDYTPGTWSTKPVGVYLDCVPGDSPIDLEYKDSSRIFGDGIHMWEHAAIDNCVDEAGNVAPLLAPYGPIMVDTKAPNCRVTPGTLYIPRTTTGTVTFALDLSDIGPSGVSALGIAGAASGGATLHSVTPGPGSPPTSLEVNATMPNSTAAKVVVNISVTDDAGNTKTCTATVKAK
jgi:hypothetical protein